MAKKKATKKTPRHKADPNQCLVIQITRHLPGPPRRSPGQTLRLQRKQLKQQGLKARRDFKVISTEPSAHAT